MHIPSLILYNGRLFTQDSDFPQATAVAIGDGLFLTVVSNAEVQALAGPKT